jgi:hypothetical protein
MVVLAGLQRKLKEDKIPIFQVLKAFLNKKNGLNP